ncbi:MAG: VOC family protein [Microthrixaceae bacterium]|nr:VOC family protein [Microthrixaceae bacterium]
MSDHAEADPTAAGDHPDRGFTHVALQVSDLDASLAFYERFAELVPVHRRTSDDGTRVAWISDLTRPFVVVLIETSAAQARRHRLGGWNHLGVGVGSREEVDRRLADADAAGCRTDGPVDAGAPVGYFGIIADPDGHHLEIAHGQQVAFTVEQSTDPRRP